MTWEEYVGLIKPVAEAFDRQFPEIRIIKIYDQIKDLDAKWFSRLCDRMIIEMKPLDIADAGRSERSARMAWENSRRITNRGNTCPWGRDLQQVLKTMGVNSVGEALEKKKKGTG